MVYMHFELSLGNLPTHAIIFHRTDIAFACTLLMTNSFNLFIFAGCLRNELLKGRRKLAVHQARYVLGSLKEV